MIEQTLFNRIRPLLLKVEKPARYVGGEYGIIKPIKKSLRIVICFPDLYEIGMSNQALKILYNRLNSLPNVSCERAFSVAADFEKELREASLPLYSLESKSPLSDFDIIAFTFGYELGFCGVLQILDLAGIPLDKINRGSSDPLVIMGGPATSNPVPYSRFVDYCWIGEAEAAFFDLISSIANRKLLGANRSEYSSLFYNHKSIWTDGKTATRNIDNDFGDRKDTLAVLPVSNIKTTQDHGSIEIMRGCPNGCRFCHAGIWYRPKREKTINDIVANVDEAVNIGGYREISLLSLSSGDYTNIYNLIEQLNQIYSQRNISFQLPSLKVNTFSLPLLEMLSKTRKSGLTFAIETPLDLWQKAMNKQVFIQDVIKILKEAKERGWKSVKFYFMLGLPKPSTSSIEIKEEEEIVRMLTHIKQECRMEIKMTIGVFVPKPHTPYQWVSQLGVGEAFDSIRFIKDNLKRIGVTVNYHDPRVSQIEGILARGSSDVGDLILSAYRNGARLDAWEEHFNFEHWNTDLDKYEHSFALDQKLPWQDINSGTEIEWLKAEYMRSLSAEMTGICSENCSDFCGICGDSSKVLERKLEAPVDRSTDIISPVITTNTGYIYRMLFSFTKMDVAAYIPHLGLVEVFMKAFIRGNLPVRFTEGFNPLPRMDFAAPLSIGIESLNEMASIDFFNQQDPEAFVSILNNNLPEGIRIKAARLYKIVDGVKRVSLSAVYGGSRYLVKLPTDTTKNQNHEVEFKDERLFKERIQNEYGLQVLQRQKMLAKDNVGEMVDYFVYYDSLYP